MEAIPSSLIITPDSSSSFSFRRRINGPYLPVKFKTIRFRPVSVKKGKGKSKSKYEGPEFGNGSGSGLVDENMIVLRKRIHEMEVAERNYELPSHWTDWEKRYYPKYRHDVCEFVGLVQVFFIKTRPGLAIGLAGLIVASLPASAVLIWIHLVEALKLGILH